MNTAENRLTWHLVIKLTLAGFVIHGVYGRALLANATTKAGEINGEVRSVSTFGERYHCGDSFAA